MAYGEKYWAIESNEVEDMEDSISIFLTAENSKPSWPDSNTPSTIAVETRRCPLTIPPIHNPA